ncbi:MAG TPA: Rrf2 family transcriptional regulator [Bacteroidales bacterium]|nr:Rrf2 family transcriptional regulator [Bacteroidales bacterium]
MSKVLNISEAATIAIHSMALIARSKTLLNAQEIAEVTGFSKNHISKVLQQLVKSNMLQSTRGPKGGFVLKRKSEEVNLLEIYRLFDGEISESTGCRMHCSLCPFRSCIFGGLSEKFSREFREYLTSKNLSTI